jgi:hypothetical protein
VSVSTALVQVVARVMAAFTGVMFAGFIALAYVEIIYVPGLTPGGTTTTTGLWQLAAATALGAVAAVVFAVRSTAGGPRPTPVAAPRSTQVVG